MCIYRCFAAFAYFVDHQVLRVYVLYTYVYMLTKINKVYDMCQVDHYILSMGNRKTNYNCYKHFSKVFNSGIA